MARLPIKILSLITILLASCAPSRHEESPVSVELNFEKSGLGAQSISSWGDPSTYCLMLHVTSPGAPFMKQPEENPTLQCPGKTPGVGIVYGLIDGAKSSVSIEVPIGPKRRIDLLKVDKNILSPELSCQEVVDVVLRDDADSEHVKVDLVIPGRNLTPEEQDDIDVTLLARGVADIVQGPNAMTLKLVNEGLGAEYTSDCSEEDTGDDSSTPIVGTDTVVPSWSATLSPGAIYLNASSTSIAISSSGHGLATDDTTTAATLIYEYAIGTSNSSTLRNSVLAWTPYNVTSFSIGNPIITDGAYYLNFRVSDQAGNFTYKNIPIFRDTVAPALPTVVNISTAPNPVASLTKFLIPDAPFNLNLSCENGSTLTFTTTEVSGLPGSAACSAGSVMLNSLTTTGGLALKNLTVNIADAAGNTSSRTLQFRHCPLGFVFVPGASASVPDFCIAKFEMSYNPSPLKYESVVNAAPKHTIAKSAAQTACQSGLHTGVHELSNLSCGLPGNLEWQKVAHLIRSESSNLSSAKYSRGYIWANPNASFCSAGPQGSPAECGEGSGNNKRTFIIPNGETVADNRVLWDFAGNLAEWVSQADTTYSSSLTLITDGSVVDFNADTNALSLFGGSNLETDSTHYIGRFYKEPSQLGGIVRGGSSMDADAGIYHTRFGVDATSGSSEIGFRCTCKTSP